MKKGGWMEDLEEKKRWRKMKKEETKLLDRLK